MTSKFSKMKDVIVTPDMLNRYFSMTKTEILVHLFLLSVCDEDRHIQRNVRALARETKIWHADVYRAIMGLNLKKMVEEKRLKTKGLSLSGAKDSRYWRVYPLPRTRKDKSELEDEALKNSTANFSAGKFNQQTFELKGKKGFLRRALEKIRIGRL